MASRWTRVLLLLLLPLPATLGYRRLACPPSPAAPATAERVDSRARVAALRREMRARGLDAYVVPATDPHLSEYTGPEFARRAWLSGFSGSTGDALVTADAAALALDRRYDVQADRQADCQWALLVTPNRFHVRLSQFVAAWAANASSAVTVGIDPRLVSARQFRAWEGALRAGGAALRAVEENLVDAVWVARPRPGRNAVFVHEWRFAGEAWTSKLARVRVQMAGKGANALLLSQLDEVAWLFNLRGSDLPYEPVFYAFALVEPHTARLYLRDPRRHLQALREHLGAAAQVRDYDADLAPDLRALRRRNGTRLWAESFTNQFVGSLLGSPAVVEDSPVFALKVVKNRVEAASFRQCSLVDSAAYVEFLSVLTAGMSTGERWTELDAAQRLEAVRGTYPEYRGPSFPTIAASGPNAAFPHYFPDNFTNRALSRAELFLLDAGSQFPGCTTDVTRTVHFGNPAPDEVEAYTRVLMGFVDVAGAVWPQYASNRRLEAAAHWPLWRAGVDYRHGTGHGIGTFLFVHELPNGLLDGSRYALREGNFQACEPGFYARGRFGVRLETVLGVEPAGTPHRWNGNAFFRFFPATLVPFERRMIDVGLLNARQVVWLNDYHRRCWALVAPILRRRGRTEALRWLRERTQPIGGGGPGAVPRRGAVWLVAAVVLCATVR